MSGDINGNVDYLAIDAELKAIGAERAVLDVREAKWLRLAIEVRIWEHFGMVSPLDYLERMLGYAPRTAQDKLRVAEALGGLPAVEAALETGELKYSAVRELTRVATAETETDWVAAARDKTLREIELLVSGRERGDKPSDPDKPEIKPRRVAFDVSPETYARMRQARAMLADTHGRRLDDDDFIAALCEAAIEGKTSKRASGKARHQVALTVCSVCDAARQVAGGDEIPVDAEVVEMARCDAEYIGSLDARKPERASHSIPPATRRLVWRRDKGRCRIPGCRSAAGLDIHHINHRRIEKEDHDPENLLLTCSSCHRATHRKKLVLGGTASYLTVERHGDRTNSRAHVGVSDAELVRDATTAIIGLGWKPWIAHVAVGAARAELGSDITIEALVFDALRRCNSVRAGS